MESTIAGVIFVVLGIVAFAAGLLNWQTLLAPARNYTFINALGPFGKRVFYCVLGIFSVGGWLRVHHRRFEIWSASMTLQTSLGELTIARQSRSN